MKRDGNDITSSSCAGILHKGLIPAASLSTRFLVPLARLVRDREKRVRRYGEEGDYIPIDTLSSPE